MKAIASVVVGAVVLLASAPQAATREEVDAAGAASPFGAPKPVRLVPLPNSDFEETPGAAHNCAPRWGCKVHSDRTAYRFTVDDSTAAGGRRSLRIEREKDEPWALATQGVIEPSLRNRRMRLSMAVRIEGASGEGGGPWVLVHGLRGNLLNDQRLVKGTQDWQRVSMEFLVGAEAQMVEVGAMLEGPGRLWIDDVRLEALAAP